MPVSMPCSVCHKMQQPFIDPKTEKVFCELCDEEQPNVNHFTKIQLKTLKQYRPKSTAPFSVKCASCQKEAQPKVINNEVSCPFCLKPHSHLSEPFKLMLKTQLKTVNKDVA